MILPRLIAILALTSVATVGAVSPASAAGGLPARKNTGASTATAGSVTPKPVGGTPLNTSISLCNSIRFFHAFNEGGGNAITDLSPFGIHCVTANANPQWGQDAKGNSALVFSQFDQGGISSQNTYAGATLSGNAITIAVVFELDNLTKAGPIISVGNGARLIASGNLLMFSCNGHSNYPVSIPVGTLTAGQQYMVVVTSQTDGSNWTARTWINGIQGSGHQGGYGVPSDTFGPVTYTYGNPFDSADNVAVRVTQGAGWNRVLSDNEIATISADPWVYFNAENSAAVATKYMASSSCVNYLGDPIYVLLSPPSLQQLPSGTVVTVTPSVGSPFTVPLFLTGGVATFTPTTTGSVTLTFANNQGLTDPAPLTCITRPGVEPSSHLLPAYTNGNQLASPGSNYLSQITSTSRRAFNAFMVGEAVGFVLPAQLCNSGCMYDAAVDSYEVRDFDGNIVTSGPVAHTTAAPTTLLLPTVTQPGWYKLRLFNSARADQFGDAAGDTTFCVLPTGTALPTPGICSYNPYLIVPDGVPAANVVSASPFESYTAAGNPAYVRYSGTITPTQSGMYTFADDPVCAHATINGSVVLEHWNAQYASTGGDKGDSAVSLTAGQAYSVVIEYMVATGANNGMPHLIVNGNRYDVAALFTDEGGSSGGLTRWIYPALDGSKFFGQTDQYLRAALGGAAGLQRLGVDSTNTPSDYAANINAFLFLQKGRDPARSVPKLLFAFTYYPNNWANGSVAAFLRGVLGTGLSSSDFVVECRNEPNDQDAANYEPQFARFYAEVKAADPDIQVIGPTTVTILPSPVDRGGGLGWWDTFLAAGGGSCLDGLSFHFYGCMDADWTTGRATMDSFQAYRISKGLDGKDLYQTEQGEAFGLYGVEESYHATRSTMARALLFEQYGLVSEHNYYWQDTSGDPEFLTGLRSVQGSPYPTLVALRTWGAELFGKNRVSNYAFGGSRDKVYMGALFVGAGSSEAVFLSGGDVQGNVPLNVIGASSLTVVQWDGKTSTLPVLGGQLNLPVGVHPVYVRLPVGVSLSVANSGWGTNLLAGVSATVSSSTMVATPTAMLTNEVFGTGDGYPTVCWSGPSPQYGAVGIEFDFSAATTLNRLHIHCPRMNQNAGTLLDYTWEYWDGMLWQPLVAHSEAVHYVPGYCANTFSTLSNYSQRRNIFEDQFSAVTTTRIRLTVNAATCGGASMLYSLAAGGQGWDQQMLSIAQIEAYNAGGSTPLSVQHPVTTWVNQYFPRVAAGDIGALLNAATDQDGITNLQKYFFDLTPGLPANRNNLPHAGLETLGGSQYLTLTYTSNPAATDVQATPEVCADLASGLWNTATPDVVATASSGQPDGAVITTMKFLVTGVNAKFLRVRLVLAW